MTDTLELSPRVRSDIDAIVHAVARRQMAPLVLFIIEMYLPLAGVAQALWIGGSPVLVPLLGKDLTERILSILEAPDALDYLIRRLESVAHQGSRA